MCYKCSKIFTIFAVETHEINNKSIKIWNLRKF